MHKLPPGRRTGSVSPSKHSRWLHLCNGLDPVRDGGMVPSILGMTGALVPAREPSVDDRHAHASRSARSPCPSGAGKNSGAGDRPRSRRPLGRDRAHARALAGPHPPGCQSGSRARVPYLITAHGMAEPWALRHKRWKKSLYLALVESKNLRRAACLHALSRPEIDHLRRLAPWTPICFVPNGVDLGLFDDLPARAVLEAEGSGAARASSSSCSSGGSRQERARPACRGPRPAAGRPS